MKKLLAILITAILLFALLPATALADSINDAHFGNDPVLAIERLNANKTSPLASDSTWDAGSRTLTLNGVNFSNDALNATVLNLPASTTVVLGEGTVNTFTATAGDGTALYAYGGTLTITGRGTLNLIGASTEWGSGLTVANRGGLVVTGGATVNAIGVEPIWIDWDGGTGLTIDSNMTLTGSATYNDFSHLSAAMLDDGQYEGIVYMGADGSGAEAKTVRIGPPASLGFADSASYDIPAGRINAAITNVDVSGGVSGGRAPYEYSLENAPGWLSINSSTGVISGTRPAAAAAAATATVRVTDSATPADSETISIDVGAVTGAAQPPQSADDPTSATGGSDTNPSTGDRSAPILWACIATVAAASVAVCLTLAQRKRRAK